MRFSWHRFKVCQLTPGGLTTLLIKMLCYCGPVHQTGEECKIFIGNQALTLCHGQRVTAYRVTRPNLPPRLANKLAGKIKKNNITEKWNDVRKAPGKINQHSMYADYHDIESAKPTGTCHMDTWRQPPVQTPNANVESQLALNSGLFPQNHVRQNITQYKTQL